MASAFKKLFRSVDRLGDDRDRRRKNAASDSPKRQCAAARCFFGRGGGGGGDSPGISRKDCAKISPLDVVPTATKGGGVVLKSSSRTFPERMSRHNQEVRTRRLMKEFHEINKSGRSSSSPAFTAELVEDNLYEWNIKLFQIDPESEFAVDMKLYGIPHVLLNLHFPDNFPFSPPFMRVISPQIEKGFVMDGGAICMELLTPRGWASAYTVEAIVMQFAASLVKGQGRIARKSKGGKEFSKKLAETSFRSLVKTHEKYGWVTPPLTDG